MEGSSWDTVRNSRNFTKLLGYNQTLITGIGDEFIEDPWISCWRILKFWFSIIQKYVNSTSLIESNL